MALDALLEQLRTGVGQPMGLGGPTRAPDAVNVPMIRHWVDALNDQNPIYLDHEAAQSAGFEGPVAPPAMLQVWTMGRPKIEGIAARGGSSGEINPNNPISMLSEAGFRGTLATNSELEFDRYLRPGDQLQSEGRLHSVSERKSTGLGEGYFVTWITTYKTDTGEEVGRQTFRVLKFDPSTIDPNRGSHSGGDAKPSTSSGAATASTVAEELPVFDLDVTTTVVVAGAIASRDFMPVHHDRDFAQAQGAPDLFMNILTSNGYVSRYVTDWAGPDALIHKIAVRLGASAVPGQTMRFTGQVLSVAPEGDREQVEVAVRAANDLGDHVTGSVLLSRPR